MLTGCRLAPPERAQRDLHDRGIAGDEDRRRAGRDPVALPVACHLPQGQPVAEVIEVGVVDAAVARIGVEIRMAAAATAASER